MQEKIANAGMKHDVDWLKEAHTAKEPEDQPEGFWYLATPYSKYPQGIEAAFQCACSAAARLIERGVNVYSPIAHTHPIAMNGGLDPLDHTIWMPLDEPMMRAAHGLFVLEMPGWDTSKGVAEEIAHFKAAGKPIRQITWPGLAVRI